ncbi:MAG: 3-keto-5-aminohexanoate cleavage protein [Saccharopolyspora rectivirgula]|jgi:uncharacterized protein (DUF849 family)|uniref:3-keto-5-aminohexanoate cleavage protein n=1 Tax=Saccharopolyspora rectivirgula TaxID=28042 RepID=UPI00240916D0|nr:3-keto-5-aminohexanoate cleavage protein [Saccharopolyspora rectivirgula]
MLQVCLNGARSPQEHYQLPVRPEELAKAAADAVAAGADEIHLHPKSVDGADTLDARVVAAVLTSVRAAAPNTPIGITTSTWTVPDSAARMAAVRSWTVLPDYATVHWHEPGAEEVAQALLDRGIGVEAGILSGTDADQYFLDSPLRSRVHRVLAKVPDLTARGAVATARSLLQRLEGVEAPILLHGQSAGAWAVLVLASQLGMDARIGLEDTLLLPNSNIASDNAELVAEAVRQMRR